MDAFRNQYGLGNPFNTYSKRLDDARFEVSVNDEIQRLLELSKNKNFSRRKREAIYKEALSLCESFHGMGFDSCDSAGDGLSDSTYSGNTSVSSVSTVSSVGSWWTRDWLELNEPEKDSDWDRYHRMIKEMKDEKRAIKLQAKKNEKFASQTKAAEAEAAGDCVSDPTYSSDTSVSSVSTVSSVNSWTKEGWFDLNELKSVKRAIKLQTKKNEKFASQTKAAEAEAEAEAEAAGAEAAGAEDRSSRFMGSLFMSDADDEGDN
jgi:hypothetical protein